MNRGHHQEHILRNDDDRALFLKTLGEACAHTGWHIQSWWLMSNALYLVVETPNANLVSRIQRFRASLAAKSLPAPFRYDSLKRQAGQKRMVPIRDPGPTLPNLKARHVLASAGNV